MKRLPTLVALAAATAGLLVGCGSSQGASDAHNPDPDSTATQTSPQTDPNDQFQPLNVNMVAQSGTYFPDGVDGVDFGCSDTLVTISTVPTQAETPQDRVTSALQFLLDDSQYYHGSPSVTNSLTLSETLELDDVEVNRSSVEIALSGDVVVQSQCEAHRIQAQLYGTAAATAGIEDVSITVGDTELNEVLGLESFDTRQVVDTDDD